MTASYDTASGCARLWLVTDVAWYLLMQPAVAYAPLFQPVQRRAQLVARCAQALCGGACEGPGGCYAAALRRLDEAGLHEQELLSAAPTVVAHLRALAAAGRLGAGAQTRAEQFVAELAAQVQLLRPGAPLPAAPAVPFAPKPAAQPQPQHRLGGSARGGAASLAPRSAGSFPVLPALPCPAAVAPDLLMLWDLCGTFQQLLRLPPVPLRLAMAAFWGGSHTDAADEAHAHSSPGQQAAASCLFADACRAMARLLDGEQGGGEGGGEGGGVLSGRAEAQTHVSQAARPPSQDDVTSACVAAAIDRAAWPARALGWHARGRSARAQEACVDGAAAAAAASPRRSDAESGSDAPGPRASSVACGARLAGRAAARALRSCIACDDDPWHSLKPQQRLALGVGLADALAACDPFRQHFNARAEAAAAARAQGRAQAHPVPAAQPPAACPATQPGDAPPPQMRAWEASAADRAVLRRGRAVGRDAVGHAYFELGGACGANMLLVADCGAASHADGGADGGADAEADAPPRAWYLVEGGSEAAAALALWLDPRHCAAERAPWAFASRLAQRADGGQEGAPLAPRFAARAAVPDGYALFDPHPASAPATPPLLTGGLAAVQRCCLALSRRAHFWRLSGCALSVLARHLRALQQAGGLSAGPWPPHPPSGPGAVFALDAVAKQVDDTCSLLAASDSLGPGWATDAAPLRGAWRQRLSAALTACQLAQRLGELQGALERWERDAPGGSTTAAAAAAPQPSPALRRQAFLRRAQQHDGSLYVPAPGDRVCVARSGLAATHAARPPGSAWPAPSLALLPPLIPATVLCVAYRRSDGHCGDVRTSVAWCLLDRGPDAPPAALALAAPLLLSDGAAEYVQPHALVTGAMARPWARGDRVGMLICDDVASATQHAPDEGDDEEHAAPQQQARYYERGVVSRVRAAEGAGGAEFDPWESVRVRFQPDGPGMQPRSVWCSPWELLTEALVAQQEGSAAAGACQELLDAPTSDDDLDWDWDFDFRYGGAHAQPLDLALQPHGLAPRRRAEGAQGRPAARGGRAALRAGVHAQQGAHRPAQAPRHAPLPHAAPPAAVACATRALLAALQSVPSGCADPPATAAQMCGMRAFWARYRAFWAPRGGAPKAPVFARVELELWPAFLAVASRGGYDAVTQGKQWICVARALPGRDLTTATSASFSMRVAYERALLAWERSAVAQQLGEPEPFALGAPVGHLVAAACGFEQRNKSKRGRTADGAGGARKRRGRSQSDDDDGNGSGEEQPQRGAPPPPPARAAPAAADFDYARAASGRRVLPRVAYAELDADEEPPPSRPTQGRARARARARQADSDPDASAETEEGSRGAEEEDSAQTSSDEDVPEPQPAPARKRAREPAPAPAPARRARPAVIDSESDEAEVKQAPRRSAKEGKLGGGEQPPKKARRFIDSDSD